MKNYSKRELYALGEPLGDSATRKSAGRVIYGGGGGGGGDSTTIQSIPEELKPLANAYTSKAINLSNQGYTPYAGQRFADMNGAQGAGVGMIADRAMNGSPVMDAANQTLTSTLQGGNTNPYLDSMVDRAQQNVVQNYNNANVSSGSFGNSGVQEQLARGLSDTASAMYGGAYDADRGRQMQALGMAQGFANQPYQDAQQLMGAGQFLQDQQQQGLDYGYQQYQDAQNLPYKQLAAMSGVFGSNLGSTSTTTQTGGGK